MNRPDGIPEANTMEELWQAYYDHYLKPRGIRPDSHQANDMRAALFMGAVGFGEMFNRWAAEDTASGGTEGADKYLALQKELAEFWISMSFAMMRERQEQARRN